MDTRNNSLTVGFRDAINPLDLEAEIAAFESYTDNDKHEKWLVEITVALSKLR